MTVIKNLWSFAYQQAWSCLFPAIIFLTLAISKVLPFPFLHRYDFILLVCLSAQVLLVLTGIETLDELKVIILFHIIGLALELFKVHMGSWAYPESAWTKFHGVPLYSGFMYASVASYMCQAWRRLDLKLLRWPRTDWVLILAGAIYLNFFTHHFLPDFRWVLTALVVLLFFNTYVSFRADGELYKMPLALSFALIGFFIWIAENIATFFGAWEYPDQQKAWHLVSFSKISSWLLLVIVSFLIVAILKHVKQKEEVLTEIKTSI
ncbi:Uncharacterized membrane protein YoaT, DUF817 family [Bacillus sp. OV322]|uniref:DUF817 domain-containing protein n=1 Tax=Bacillus sp. OV322 TaxID=1882764 RepID=UPI0008EAB1C4|nr:DUF817 domain-containing protein [Bacillus sp. OV322]SFC29766.1 Uncharacterized membrane protein YoaT, DUF817 family [Bacillus sp. OV322]